MSSKIFISYSSKDKIFSRKLYSELKKFNLEVWIDIEEINNEWILDISKAIPNSDLIMIVLSKNSFSSQNVQEEILMAIEEKKKIIPILIDDCKIPYGLKSIQYVNFKKGFNYGFNELKVKLKKNGINLSADKSNILYRLSQNKWTYYIAILILSFLPTIIFLSRIPKSLIDIEKDVNQLRGTIHFFDYYGLTTDDEINFLIHEFIILVVCSLIFISYRYFLKYKKTSVLSVVIFFILSFGVLYGTVLLEYYFNFNLISELVRMVFIPNTLESWIFRNIIMSIILWMVFHLVTKFSIKKV